MDTCTCICSVHTYTQGLKIWCFWRMHELRGWNASQEHYTPHAVPILLGQLPFNFSSQDWNLTPASTCTIVLLSSSLCVCVCGYLTKATSQSFLSFRILGFIYIHVRMCSYVHVHIRVQWPMALTRPTCWHEGGTAAREQFPVRLAIQLFRAHAHTHLDVCDVLHIPPVWKYVI